MESRQQHELRLILQKHPQYGEGGLLFVQECVVRTVQEIERHESKHRHISGQELLEGFRVLALERFGPLAYDILNNWGITSGTEVGKIVFLLVEHDLLGKSEEDSIEDFYGGYDFETAFLHPYKPPETPLPSMEPIA